MFHVSRILCPTDFSPGAAAALDIAASISERYEASIDVLHIWSPPVVVAFDAALIPSAEDLAAYTESLQKKLDEVIASVPRPHRFVRKHMVQGGPGEEILAFAAREKSELIVMGTHGRTGISHVLLGSVAERIVRTAPIPVLTTVMRKS
jgi:universal stress protein A